MARRAKLAASRAKPARRLPFHVKPIPPCGTSHAEQPLCHADHAAKGRTTPRKTATPHEPVAQTCGFYPAALFVSPLCQTHCGIAYSQLHNSASGLRIREVSTCVRLAVRLVRQQSISPRSGARGATISSVWKLLPKNTGISSFDEYNSSCSYSSLRIIESAKHPTFRTADGSSIRLSHRELKGSKDARGPTAQARSAHRPTP